jgi:hypothetical protein
MTAYGGRGRRLLTAAIAVAAAVSLCLLGQEASATPAHTRPDSLPARQTVVNCGGGVQEIFYTPAPGFDPLTATDAELVANGLPIRPSDAADMTAWRNMVTGPARQPGRACVLGKGPATTGGGSVPLGGGPAGGGTARPAAPGIRVSQSVNWAGYVVTGHTYEDVYGYWTIPNVGTNPPSFAAASSQWIGIGQGGRSGLPLVQTGTEADINVGGPGPTYYLWWEVVPNSAYHHVIDLGVTVRNGNRVYAHVHLSRDDAYLTLDDLTDRAGMTFRFNSGRTTINPDGTAEWVLERTENAIFGIFPPLARSTVTFSTAQTSGIRLARRGVGTVPRFAVDMYNCTNPIRELAQTLGITRAGTQFEVKWLRYGHEDRANSGRC